MTAGPDDADIVSGLRAGDRAAWDSLCQQYGERLWSYVARLVGHDHVAVADVFQETLLAVAKSGRQIRPDSAIWPWLGRIGHNQAALYWRKRYRERDVEQVGAAPPTTTDGDPVAALAQLETVETVRVLLSEMNANHVALLTAKYLDGLTVPQIVEVFGGTVEGVRSSLARARRSFREKYQRLGIEQ